MRTLQDRCSIKIFHYGLLLCFMLLVSIACIYRFYLFPGTSDILTDADIIQLPTMFLDLQVSINNFWGWKLPDAPYYFPDTLLFLGINWMVGNIWQAIILYSLLQSCLVVIALSWLYRELAGKKAEIYLTILLITALFFTQAYITVFDRVKGFIKPYIYYLSSYIHFGTYICTLICLAASLHYFRTNKKSIWLSIVIITFLTTVSDLLFAIYFTIPLIATLIISGKAKLLTIDRQIKQFCYSIFSISLVAYIYNKYFDSLAASTTVEIKLDKIIDSIKIIVVDLGQAGSREQFFLIFAIVFPTIYLIVHTWKLHNRLLGDRQNSNNKDGDLVQFILGLYILLAAIANILAVIILGKYSDVNHARYFIFVYYSPGLIALSLISLKIEKIKHISKIILAIITIITIVTGTFLANQKLPTLSQIFPPPNYASCFDLQQSQAGLSGYWQSKPLIAFSQRRIQAVTIKPNGEPETWNSNRYWYTESWQQPGSKPPFKFILMQSLDPNAIATRYGQPTKVEACLDSEIWWYEDSDILYSNLMRDGL